MPDFYSEGGGLVAAYKAGAELAQEATNAAFERKMRQQEFGLRSQEEQLAEQRFQQDKARDAMTAAEAESKYAADQMGVWRTNYGGIPPEKRSPEAAQLYLDLHDRALQANAIRLHAYAILHGDDLAQNHSDASQLFDDLHHGRLDPSDVPADQLANAVTIATRRLPSSFIDTPNSTSEVSRQIVAVQNGMLAQQQGQGTQQLMNAFSDMSKHDVAHLVGQTHYDGSKVTDAQVAALTPVASDPSKVVPILKITTNLDGKIGTQHRAMQDDHGNLLAHPDSTNDASVKAVSLNSLFDHFGTLSNFHAMLNSPGYRDRLIENYMKGGEELNQQSLNDMIVLGTDPTKYQPDVDIVRKPGVVEVYNKKTGGLINRMEVPLSESEKLDLQEKRTGIFEKQQQGALLGREIKSIDQGSGRWGAGGAAPADDVESTAQAIANYDMAPPTGRTAYTPQGQAIMARVRQINSSYNAADYQASAHAVDRFDSGKQGDTVRSFNVLVGHLKTLGEAADALHNGNVPLFNRLSNLVAQETGQEAPKDFNAVRGVVADEIIKAVTGSAGALGDREDVQKQLDRASSPQQMRGVINHITELAGSQLRGLQKQYEASTKRKDFNDKYLYPETLQALGEGTADTGAAAAGGAPASLPKGWSIQKEK